MEEDTGGWGREPWGNGPIPISVELEFRGDKDHVPPDKEQRKQHHTVHPDPDHVTEVLYAERGDYPDFEAAVMSQIQDVIDQLRKLFPEHIDQLRVFAGLAHENLELAFDADIILDDGVNKIRPSKIRNGRQVFDGDDFRDEVVQEVEQRIMDALKKRLLHIGREQD